MHMTVVRLFVESILRYGLPPQFQAAVVKPLPKMEARLRTALAANFGTGAWPLSIDVCRVEMGQGAAGQSLVLGLELQA